MSGNETITPAVLITIPLSHYCEKARWALDRLELPYREEPHAPLLHRLATKRKDGGAVPVLVHGSSRLIDSTDILVYADGLRGGDILYPRDAARRGEVDAFEEQFDTQLGPHTRRLVRAGYKITPQSAQRSLDRVRAVFSEVDRHLSDGRRFLTGEYFTAADLTFAALAAPVLFPIECRAVLPALDAVPVPMREEVLRFRSTAAGKFALRLYSQERGCLPLRKVLV
jgi:glutathione S-transferase